MREITDKEIETLKTAMIGGFVEVKTNFDEAFNQSYNSCLLPFYTRKLVQIERGLAIIFGYDFPTED